MRQFDPPEYLVGPLHQLADEIGRDGLRRTLDGRTESRCWPRSRDGTPCECRTCTSATSETAHARASGKLLLAFAPEPLRAAYLRANPLTPVTPRTIVQAEEFDLELERTRLRGYAVDEEEFREGVACVSAPVLDGETPIAAYSISAPVDRFRQRRDELIACTVRVAESAGRAAGNAGHTNPDPRSVSLS